MIHVSYATGIEGRLPLLTTPKPDRGLGQQAKDLVKTVASK